jgi:hydroxyacylglutathione hydrolase
MELIRIETPGIAHFAYLIADGSQAAIVDPRRDVDEYLDKARSLGARIVYVLETHRQEDFVMGSAHLARRTGARIVNGRHALFGHGDLRLDDGDTFELGRLKIRALHTPGHTPESMSYAVYSPEVEDRAWCVFTGDTLFFGTTGRTDLSDAGRAVENAALLYDSAHDKLAGLGDSTLVLPAHGAGSVCGSGMAERPFSTIGEEKRYNEVFTLGRDAFARKKGGERLPRPPYFEHMEVVNLRGGLEPTILPGDVALLDAAAFEKRSAHELRFDTREPEAFASGRIDGSHNIWLGGLPVFGGWIGDAGTPIFLITDRDGDVDVAVRHLTRIGLDELRGALAGGFASWRKAGKPMPRSGVITPAELASERRNLALLDVRDDEEFAAGHIEGARHIYVGGLPKRADDLGVDKNAPLVVTCSIGHRSGLAASVLLRAGFTDVRNLLGGMTAWQQLGLPVEQ